MDADGLPEGLPDSVRDYLLTCSAEMVSEVLACLRVTTQHHAKTRVALPQLATSRVTTPHPAVSKGTTAEACSMSAGFYKTGGGITKNKVTKKTKTEPAGPPKRPVNSWLCFRKFYCGSLSPGTQKAISKVLTLWWKADPFHAKWAILAKAYSIVRGELSKTEAPLEVFFNHCAPLIGIVPAEQYPEIMGWHLGAPDAYDKDKIPVVTRTFTPDLAFLDESLTSTMLGVADLVQHCYQVGYALAPPVNPGCEQTTTESLTMTIPPSQTANSGTDEQAVRDTAAPGNTTSGNDLAFSSDAFGPTQGSTFAQRDMPTPGGAQALNAAAFHAQQNQENYTTTDFDPTTNYAVSFDPSMGGEGGSAWDAYTMTENMSVEELASLDWSAFLTDDMLQ